MVVGVAGKFRFFHAHINDRLAVHCEDFVVMSAFSYTCFFLILQTSSRSRKKTISDMSGMLRDLDEDLSGPISPAVSKTGVSEKLSISAGDLPKAPTSTTAVSNSIASDVSSDATTTQGQLRSATVPGEFRKTQDPFQAGIWGSM